MKAAVAPASGLCFRKAAGRNPKGPTAHLPPDDGRYLECTLHVSVWVPTLTQTCTRTHVRTESWIPGRVNEVLCTLCLFPSPLATPPRNPFRIAANSRIILLTAAPPQMSAVIVNVPHWWAFTNAVLTGAGNGEAVFHSHTYGQTDS